MGEPRLWEEARRNCHSQAREGGTALREQSAIQLSGANESTRCRSSSPQDDARGNEIGKGSSQGLAKKM